MQNSVSGANEKKYFDEIMRMVRSGSGSYDIQTPNVKRCHTRQVVLQRHLGATNLPKECVQWHSPESQILYHLGWGTEERG